MTIDVTPDSVHAAAPVPALPPAEIDDTATPPPPPAPPGQDMSDPSEVVPPVPPAFAPAVPAVPADPIVAVRPENPEVMRTHASAPAPPPPDAAFWPVDVAAFPPDPPPPPTAYATMLFVPVVGVYVWVDVMTWTFSRRPGKPVSVPLDVRLVNVPAFAAVPPIAGGDAR